MDTDESLDLAYIFTILRLCFYVTFSGMFCLSLAVGVWIPTVVLYLHGASQETLLNAIGMGAVYMVVSQMVSCLLMAFFPWDRGLEKLVDAIYHLAEES